MTTLLQVDSVAKRFGGVQALTDVSFRVERGRIKGLIGPNGAGKTTLFNCICGVMRVDGGHVRYAGRRDLHGVSPHRRARMGIARTFQTLELFRELTVLENLMVPVDAQAPRGLISDALRLPGARHEERRAEERARDSCTSSTSPRSPGSPAASSRSASSAGSSSAAPSLFAPPCCSSTSPPPASTCARPPSSPGC